MKIVEEINKSMKEGNIDDVQQIKSDLLDLKQKMEEQKIKKYSFTDPDARFMQCHKKTNKLRYNAQIIVDKNGIILTNDVVQQSDDRNQSIPMVNQVEQDFGQLPKGTKFIGDAGYENGEALEELEQRGYDLFVPGKNMVKKPKKKFAKANFEYDEENDCYVCPEGKLLTNRGIRYHKWLKRNVTTYRTKLRDCIECPFKPQCCKKAITKPITALPQDKLFNRIKVKLKTPEGKATYKLRKQTVERSFGDIKHNKGFRNFLLRGKEKVKIEFNLACIAHNLVMINNLMKKRSLAGC